MPVRNLVLFCLLVAVPVPGVSVAGGGNPVSPVDIPAFLEKLDELRQTARIPGLSVAVLRDQEVVLAVGLGQADPDNGVPATADTPYRIASVTKPIAATVALKLAEDGILDLDRPMAEYSDWADFCDDFSRQPSIFARDLDCDRRDHTLRHLLSHTATGTPGGRFSYNPILYSWASRPIMAAAGGEFSTLVGRYVFEPAGMGHSARTNRELPVRDDLAVRLAPPHRVNDSGTLEQSPTLDPQGDGAAGGVVSTVLDLARFDAALDRGDLISAGSRTLMMTPAEAADGTKLPYGLGWFVQTYQGYKLVWHSGWWEDAYSALYLKVPEESLTFIVLANSEGVWWDNPLDSAEVQRSAFAQAFFRAFLGDKSRRPCTEVP